MKNKIFGNYIAKLGEFTDLEIEKRVSDALPKSKKIIYLDVGCHDGEKTLKRAQVIGTKSILGIDLKTTGAKIAQKNGVKMYFGDLNKHWPLKDQSVDCVTATEVIEHMIDVDNFLSEIKRILKPKGLVIISTDNLAGYHNIFALLLGYQPYTGPYLSRIYPIGHRPNAKYYENSSYHEMNPHLNVMTSRSLEQLLTFNGFKVKSISGAGFYPLPPIIANIFSSIDKRHASHCIVVAQK